MTDVICGFLISCPDLPWLRVDWDLGTAFSGCDLKRAVLCVDLACRRSYERQNDVMAALRQIFRRFCCEV